MGFGKLGPIQGHAAVATCRPSGSGHDNMCLTAHFIDNDWKLHKRIINFCHISSHRSEAIRKAIEKCLRDWGIDKVFTITVDAISYLKKKNEQFRNLYSRRKIYSFEMHCTYS